MYMIAFTQKGYTEFPWIEDRRGQKELDVFLLSDNYHARISFKKETQYYQITMTLRMIRVSFKKEAKNKRSVSDDMFPIG